MDTQTMTSAPLSELEHIELAKAIAAAKRGEGPMPDIALLRRAVDSIRTKRQDFVASEAKPRRAAASAGPKKSVEISLDDIFGNM